MSSKGAFIAGAVVGGIVGAMVGMLFAPVSGKETQERLKEEFNQLSQRAKEEALKMARKFRSSESPNGSSINEEEKSKRTSGVSESSV